VSLSLSLCVPAPVHLRPCPFVSLCPCPSVSLFLSLSMSFSVLIPVRLCRCPSVSLSLSVCVPVHLCFCPLAPLSLCVPVPIRLYPSCILSQRTSLATDNFQRLFYCQKNLRITFKVTFVANGQLSALITQGRRQRIIFSAYFNPFKGPSQRKLLFESNLPISECTIQRH
jgi:hypothetical protein